MQSGRVGGVQLERDAVRVTELQQGRPPEILDPAVRDAELIKACGSGVQCSTVRHGKAEVIQAHSILVEAISAGRHGSQAQQTGSNPIDDAAEQEPELLAS